MVYTGLLASTAEPDHHLRPAAYHPADPLRGKRAADCPDHRYRHVVQAAQCSRCSWRGLRTTSGVFAERACQSRSWTLVETKDEFRSPPGRGVCTQRKHTDSC